MLGCSCFWIVWVQEKHFFIVCLRWYFDLLNSAHERIQFSCQEDRRILPSPVLRNEYFEGFDSLFQHCFGVIVWGFNFLFQHCFGSLCGIQGVGFWMLPEGGLGLPRF